MERRASEKASRLEERREMGGFQLANTLYWTLYSYPWRVSVVRFNSPRKKKKEGAHASKQANLLVMQQTQREQNLQMAHNPKQSDDT